MPCDDQDRHVDVLCFTESNTDSAVVRADHYTNESETNSAAKPVALEDDAPNEEEDVKSNSSEEADFILRSQDGLIDDGGPSCKKVT